MVGEKGISESIRQQRRSCLRPLRRFIFLVVILGSTQAKAPAAFAGLAIGLTLVLIHIVGIQVTGVSVNPARSFGPAVFTGALTPLWLFFVAPLLGAAVAGLLFKSGLLEADD